MQGIMFSPQSKELADPSSAQRPSGSAFAEDDVDNTLARRSREGDQVAYGELVARHEKRVHALVTRIIGQRASREDIDDTVQDIFIQAWRALPRFRGDSRFSTWLYRIATNMAIKQWHRGKKQRHIVAEEDLPEAVRMNLTDHAPGPAEQAERQSRNRALQAAIDALPEKQRTVLLLHYFEDYSCDDIAQMLGCSVGTVWSRLHYACRKLRTSLEWLQQS